MIRLDCRFDHELRLRGKGLDQATAAAERGSGIAGLAGPEATPRRGFRDAGEGSGKTCRFGLGKICRSPAWADQPPHIVPLPHAGDRWQRPRNGKTANDLGGPSRGQTRQGCCGSACRDAAWQLLMEHAAQAPKVIGMFDALVQSTSIPVLEQVVRFAQARHTVLAGNLANLHTPGYRVRDLSVEDFQARLREAIEARQASRAARSPGLTAGPPGLAATWPGLAGSSPGWADSGPGVTGPSPGLAETSPGLTGISPGLPRRTGDPAAGLAEVAQHSQSIVYHDQSNIATEEQITEMVKNQLQHNLAVALLASQFRLLQTAISERV